MTSRAERVKALTDKLEQGVQEVFSSGQYQAWLNTLAKFHRYSFNNVLLIQMQRPGATCVAGFQAWKKKFGRTVKKGEKGISILAPCPYTRWVEQSQADPAPDGEPAPKKELVVVQGFKSPRCLTSARPRAGSCPAWGWRSSPVP